ncbi:MAG: hypothetical protein WBE68_09165 [Candidatus Nitrosopolaris sp.]
MAAYAIIVGAPVQDLFESPLMLLFSKIEVVALKYFVGCSKLSQYQTYLDTLDPQRDVAYYSRIFDFAEIYLNNIVNKLTFKKLTKQTPDNFRFTLRIPQVVIQSNDTERT